MSTLDRIRQMPLASRRALATGTIFLAGLALVGIWVATDFGISERNGGISAISDGAGSVGNIIQEQTDKYAETRAELEANLDQTLKSSALVLPESLQDIREEPDGVLYLGYDHRERGVATKLDDVTFYPSYTLVRATITNESAEQIFVDAGHGSVIVQKNGTLDVSVQPLFQSGTPKQLAPGESVQTNLTFGPINGRLAFELIIGDYTTGEDFSGDAWSAKFSIDPDEVVSP